MAARQVSHPLTTAMHTLALVSGIPLCAGTVLISTAAQATPLWVAASQTDTQSLTTSYQYVVPPSSTPITVPVYSASVTSNQVNPNYNNTLQSTFALPYGGQISGYSTQSLLMSDSQIVASVATLGSGAGNSGPFAFGFVSAASSYDLVFQVSDPLALAVQYFFNYSNPPGIQTSLKNLATGQTLFSQDNTGAIVGPISGFQGNMTFTLTPGPYELQAAASTDWSNCCESAPGGEVDLNLQASLVPEPSTALLFAAGALMGLAVRGPRPRTSRALTWVRSARRSNVSA